MSPDIWRTHADNCTSRNLVFSFQVNPGFDSIVFSQTDINSFNEWHEGHQFEPMSDRAGLTDAERALGCHNADTGTYRLDTPRGLVQDVLHR